MSVNIEISDFDTWGFYNIEYLYNRGRCVIRVIGKEQIDGYDSVKLYNFATEEVESSFVSDIKKISELSLDEKLENSAIKELLFRTNRVNRKNYVRNYQMLRDYAINAVSIEQLMADSGLSYWGVKNALMRAVTLCCLDIIKFKERLGNVTEVLEFCDYYDLIDKSSPRRFIKDKALVRGFLDSYEVVSSLY